jgi:hypothetical protein
MTLIRVFEIRDVTIDPTHQRNIGLVVVPPPTSPPAFLGLSPIRKDGFSVPPKFDQS